MQDKLSFDHNTLPLRKPHTFFAKESLFLFYKRHIYQEYEKVQSDKTLLSAAAGTS